MVEIVSGLQTTLSQIKSGTLTFKGKPLEFKEVDNSNGQVYQASTNLTDEEIALGNNDFIITFSLEQAVGNVVVSQVPIEEKEREEIAKAIKKDDGSKHKAKEMNRAESFLKGSKSTNTSTSTSTSKTKDSSSSSGSGSSGSSGNTKGWEKL